jgi:hypothetical protein
MTDRELLNSLRRRRDIAVFMSRCDRKMSSGFAFLSSITCRLHGTPSPTTAMRCGWR